MPGPRGVPSPALQGLRLGTSGTAGWDGVRTASTLQIDHLPHPHVSPRQALHSSPTTQTVTAHATRPSPLASSQQRDQLEVVPRAQLELPGHANDAPYTQHLLQPPKRDYLSPNKRVPPATDYYNTSNSDLRQQLHCFAAKDGSSAAATPHLNACATVTGNGGTCMW